MGAGATAAIELCTGPLVRTVSGDSEALSVQKAGGQGLQAADSSQHPASEGIAPATAEAAKKSAVSRIRVTVWRKRFCGLEHSVDKRGRLRVAEEEG